MKKNIGIDLTSLDDNFSGIERYTLEITKNMIQSDQENIYTLFFKNKIDKHFESLIDNNKIIAIVVFGKKLIVNQFKLPRVIKKAKCDTLIFPAFPASLLLRKSKKYSIYSVIHDLVPFDCPKTMKWKSKLLFKFGIKHVLKISQGIIANSEFTKRRIIEHFSYSEEKICIAPCATNISIVDNNETNIFEKYNLPKKYVLTLSTLEPRKNIRWLLKTMEVLWENDPIAPKLVIVGRRGWKYDKILDNLSPNVIKNIIFTGFVDDVDLNLVYENCDFFIFPSIYEGFGIPIVEALSLGKYVLASHIDASYEIIGNKDYLFKLNDVNSFCEKFKYISDLISKDIKLSGELKNRIKEYSWEKSAENILYFMNGKGI